MIFSDWTPLYTPPSVPGVQDGNLELPAITEADWSLKEATADSATYILNTTSTYGYPAVGVIELKCSVVSNPYVADKQNSLPISAQVPGLTARKVYWKYTLYGTTTDACQTCPEYLTPLSCSGTFILPTGVNITIEQLAAHFGYSLSWVSKKIVNSGEPGRWTIDPCARVPGMANGALRLTD